jgi:hypothetical protein
MVPVRDYRASRLQEELPSLSVASVCKGVVEYFVEVCGFDCSWKKNVSVDGSRYIVDEGAVKTLGGVGISLKCVYSDCRRCEGA